MGSADSSPSLLPLPFESIRLIAPWFGHLPGEDLTAIGKLNEIARINGRCAVTDPLNQKRLLAMPLLGKDDGELCPFGTVLQRVLPPFFIFSKSSAILARYVEVFDIADTLGLPKRNK